MRPSGLTLRLMSIWAEPFEPLRVRFFGAGGSTGFTAGTGICFTCPLPGAGAGA